MEQNEIEMLKEKPDQTFEMNQRNKIKSEKQQNKKKRRKRPNMDFLFNSPPLFNSNVFPDHKQVFENQVRRKPQKVPEKVDFVFDYQAGKFDDYLNKVPNLEVS